MGAANYTPAPWSLVATDPNQGWNGFEVFDSERKTVIADVHGPQSDWTSDANARLIAAAPDLLEALAEACKIIADLSAYANNNGGMIDDETFARGLAAIHKATGQ